MARAGCGVPQPVHKLLKRFRIRMVLGAFFVEKTYQLLGGGGTLHLTESNDVFGASLLPVQLFVGATVGA